MIAIYDGIRGLGGILFLVAYLIFRTTPRDRFFDFSETESIMAALAIVGGAVLVFGGSALKSAAFRDTSTQRAQHDVTMENRQPPSDALVLLRAFEKMGFKRVGETHETGPGMKANEGTTWFMANPNGTLVLEVVQSEDLAMCQLSTIFADESILESSYPIGEKIDKPNFYSRFTKKNVQTLYKEHVTLARELVKKHGKPRSMTNISQLLAWDRVYRERYSKYKMGNLVTKQLLDFAIIMTIIVGIIAVVLVLETV